ncbi:MAG: phosphodiester glycosidase family protein [Verrucomicrobiales bacterium]|nr:phosphodiester glycosidase family protein [Verrucomicrobiales bacterium]
MLIVGMLVGTLVGCSTVQEEPGGDGLAEEFPEGGVPRAEIVGEEVAEPVPEVLVVEGTPVVEVSEVSEVSEVPVVEVEKKRKRGWGLFSRKEKSEEVVGAEIEAVEPAKSELVVSEAPVAAPAVAVAEEVGVVEVPVEKKRKRGWGLFSRKEKREEEKVETEEVSEDGEPVEAVVEEARPAAPKPAKDLAWKLRFPGVDLLEIERAEPRMMRGWAARVNAADVEWKVTEGNGGDEGETGGLRTSTFLKDYGCDLAVNGAPYSPIELFEDLPQDIIGLQVSNGKVVSRADSSKPVLAFGREGKGRVLEAGSYGDGSGLWDAVAGFSVVLRDGSVVGTGGELHPRTAAGVSRDGGTIYLLVIDGRQPGHSEGATTADLGNLLAELGSWDGINLDGGGTTTMVAKGAGGKAEILNTTINGGIPGLERVSGSHLGLRVK